MTNGDARTPFADDDLALIKGVVGEPKERLEEAYESFAERVRDTLAEKYGGELDESFFDDRPFIETVVYVRPRAHNNWVKEYWVKAY